MVTFRMDSPRSCIYHGTPPVSRVQLIYNDSPPVYGFTEVDERQRLLNIIAISLLIGISNDTNWGPEGVCDSLETISRKSA